MGRIACATGVPTTRTGWSLGTLGGMAPSVISIFVLGALVRVGFALWAPGVPLSDGLFYHILASLLAETGSYVNLDGSPAIRWMPGWPALLAALYQLFGLSSKVGMLACALLDAGTAAVTTALGIRLFGLTVGRVSGLLYALWPGLVYYSGNLFSEPLFNLLFVSTLLLLSFGREGLPRPRLELAAGLCFGLAAYVKSEPLALAPALSLAIWRLDPRPAVFLRRSAALIGVAGLLLAPWTIRNWLTFERFIPTSASGGVAVHLANQRGATGLQDFWLNKELSRRYGGKNVAETTIQRNDVGWVEARRFLAEHPGEALSNVVRKLRFTYDGDIQGARTIRGPGAPEAWHLSVGAYRRLVGLANVWWWGAMVLAGIGLTTLGRWPPGAAALLLGPMLTFVVLHAIFLGGQRFHVPEIPILALLGGHGVSQLIRWSKGLRLVSNS